MYYGQILIFLAAFAYCLFAAKATGEKLAFAAIAGAILGWLWLTREEGLWVVPAIGIVAAVAIIRPYRPAALRQTAMSLMVVAGVFAAINIGFQTANWLAYGKFVGVDFKEANFQRALKALGGVDSSGPRPFVPVTRGTLERIYSVSPTFASLRDYYEGPRGKEWLDLSCQTQSATCGEITAGFFVWSLRLAAADAGHYSSPQAASAFFGRIADEISRACERGALVCHPSLIAEMPHVTREQLEQIPQLYLNALDMLLVRHPLQTEPQSSSGNASTLDVNLQFLNHPLHSDIPPGLVLQGWYYGS